MHLPSGPELIFILGLALLIFGPKKLPEIGKTIGQGLRELRKASREITDAFDDFREPLDSLSSSFDAPVHDSRPEPDNGHESADSCSMSPSEDIHSSVHAGIDTPKETEDNVANSMGREPDGLGDHYSGDRPPVRDQEAAGDRQVDG